jgi:hypothetical protein
MSRSLKSAGIIAHGQSATPGVWMKPTSKSKANGSTSIAPSISRVETVDFLLSKRRDVAAAKRFFSRAAKHHGAPKVITLDGYAASHRAVDKLPTKIPHPSPLTSYADKNDTAQASDLKRRRRNERTPSSRREITLVFAALAERGSRGTLCSLAYRSLWQPDALQTSPASVLRRLNYKADRINVLPSLRGSVADRRKIHAASMLYHIQNGSVPKLVETSN